jgi:tetratricopeptide (TPR) repeat protein
MAQSVESSVRNAAANVRIQLVALEKAAVKPAPATIETLLTGMDAAAAELARLEAEGMDVRSEMVRFDNLRRKLESHPRAIARAAAGLPGGMNALRAAHPPAENPWWQADYVQAAHVRKTLWQIAGILAAVAGVLALVYVVMTYVFPPDPRAVALITANNQIETRIAENDWPGALQVAEDAYSQWPDDLELAAWVAVLAEKNDDPERATAAFADLQRLTQAEPLRYWLLRSDIYGRTGDYEQAFAAAQEALHLAPENPEATFAVGRTAEAMGDRATALEYLDKTYQLAEESNPQLALNARVLWGSLVQQIELPTPAGTLTP